jgi:RNA polymerase sigma-70 factor, ECF subfamily
VVSDLVLAIEQAYRNDYRRFLSLAVAILGDVDTGRDAVQEAFARALRSRGTLRDDDRLSGWLWRTLVNVCLAEKNRRKRPTPRPHPESNGHPEDWPELRAVIAALPEQQRLVLFLRHYADLDYDSIAAVVGRRPGTVAATLHAAHRKVREAIKEEVQL